MECTEQSCVGVRPRVHLRNLLTGFEEIRGENSGCNLISFRVDCVFTLDAGLLARSQYSEGPTTGHLDTGFSWFPWV
jgi:hypothetical protein